MNGAQIAARFGIGAAIGLISAASAMFVGSALTSGHPQPLPGEMARFNAPINASRDVSWEQKLDYKISPDTTFRDELGRNVPIGSFFNKRPVIVVMPFYRCPGICTQELNGLVDAFKDEKLQYKVGRDFDVVTVSITPKERHDLATMKKREYMDMLAQPGADSGWHFLTGTDPSIHKLAAEVGFHYKYNPVNDQYAHPGGIIVLSPQGVVSRYFFGVGYNPTDLRLSLTEAGQGKIGGVADTFVLACYHYDPATGKYGLAIFRLLQVMGFATVFALGGFMFFALRKDFTDKRGKMQPSTTVIDERSIDHGAERES